MINTNELHLNFDENRLPPGQIPIVTNSMELFQLFNDMIMRSKQHNGGRHRIVRCGQNDRNPDFLKWSARPPTQRITRRHRN